MKTQKISPSRGIQLFEPAEVERTYVTMRDGVKLYVEVFRPDAPGEFPSILTRNPYHDVDIPPHTRDKKSHLDFVSRGYVVVEGEVRGTGISEGKFSFLRNDGNDGYDTIMWMREQPWCNGSIGLFGLSYLAMDQFSVAGQNPPGLKAMFAGVGGADLYDDMVYPGGVLGMLALRWSQRMIGRIIPPAVPKLMHMPEEADPRIYETIEKVHGERTMKSLEHIFEGGLFDIDFLKEWIAHPTDGPFWRRDSPYSCFDKIKTPVYLFGGWYDYFARGVIRTYLDIDAPKKLIMGPWFHGGREGLDYLNIQLRWFDYWLKGIDNGIMDEPPIRVFVVGKDEWRFEDSWPPKTRALSYHLRSGASEPVHSLNDGLLSSLTPGAGEEPDEVVHDPSNPVPSIGFRLADLRRAEKCMLTYTSEPLEKDLEVAGEMALHLHMSTSEKDVDWMAKITDVYPDGGSVIITSGVLKGSHHKSHEKPEDLVPGKVYELLIKMAPTWRVFAKGHMMRLDLANSDFPLLLPNPVASQSSVFHDSQHGSCLVLPVIG
jgi:putative CocE/NonD family hydrolase